MNWKSPGAGASSGQEEKDAFDCIVDRPDPVPQTNCVSTSPLFDAFSSDSDSDEDEEHSSFVKLHRPHSSSETNRCGSGSNYNRRISLPATLEESSQFRRGVAMSDNYFNPINDGNVSYVGWLSKKGNLRKSWKRRWFVLKNNVLSYYENDKTGSALAYIPLRDCSGVSQLAESETGGSKNSFKLEHNSRTYYLSADNVQEYERWVTALSASCSLARQRRR